MLILVIRHVAELRHISNAQLLRRKSYHGKSESFKKTFLQRRSPLLSLLHLSSFEIGRKVEKNESWTSGFLRLLVVTMSSLADVS